MEEKQSELRLLRTLHIIAPFYLRPHSHDALRPFKMSTLRFGLVLGWGVFTGNLALSLFSNKRGVVEVSGSGQKDPA